MFFFINAKPHSEKSNESNNNMYRGSYEKERVRNSFFVFRCFIVIGAWKDTFIYEYGSVFLRCIFVQWTMETTNSNEKKIGMKHMVARVSQATRKEKRNWLSYISTVIELICSVHEILLFWRLYADLVFFCFLQLGMHTLQYRFTSARASIQHIIKIIVIYFDSFIIFSFSVSLCSDRCGRISVLHSVDLGLSYHFIAEINKCDFTHSFFFVPLEPSCISCVALVGIIFRFAIFSI